jgi:hypothetical protein
MNEKLTIFFTFGVFLCLGISAVEAAADKKDNPVYVKKKVS